MALLNLLDVSAGFGGPLLLDKVNLQVNPAERVCLTGRNGAGKSTLLRIAAGQLSPDSGDVLLQAGHRAAYLPQEVPDATGETVREIIRGHEHSPENWERELRIDRLLSEMELDGGGSFTSLSAGLKRRTFLARALADDPALLLLDEPTNHLDVKAIEWLENFLSAFRGALFFVTHDRMLVRRLATRILELDRGRLTSWACDYDTYLRRREELLEAEATQQAAFDKKLAEEEKWLRQGIKARRTRNEGRVRKLLALREERRQRRERAGTAKIQMQDAGYSGEKVIEADAVSFQYGEEFLLKDFSTLIGRGDKIGIVGPNGTGKSTLLRILLGKLQPSTGAVKLGTRLEIAYFDQMREQLDPEKTVRDNLVEHGDTIEIEGKSRHVISYLQDFLFTPDRANSPVKSLSGGERNRLLLCRLFTRPSNLLVLDEPTNDLDAETLELLEERLVEYRGTILLVSHDRAFLNNVATSLLVFEGDGTIAEYTGGYDDYLRQKPSTEHLEAKQPKKRKTATRPTRPRRFTNREQRELENLPSRIEAIEQQQQELAEQLADPSIYQQGPKPAEVQEKLDTLEKELAAAYARWEELDNLREQLETT